MDLILLLDDVGHERHGCFRDGLEHDPVFWCHGSICESKRIEIEDGGHNLESDRSSATDEGSQAVESGSDDKCITTFAVRNAVLTQI